MNKEEEKEKIIGTRIVQLKGKTDFQVWKVRVQAKLGILKGWSAELKCPIDTEQANELVVSLLSDEILEQVMAESIPLTASKIWLYLVKTFISSDLSAQANGVTGLIGFMYEEATMQQNKTALLLLKKELIAAFEGKNKHLH